MKESASSTLPKSNGCRRCTSRGSSCSSAGSWHAGRAPRVVSFAQLISARRRRDSPGPPEPTGAVDRRLEGQSGGTEAGGRHEEPTDDRSVPAPSYDGLSRGRPDRAQVEQRATAQEHGEARHWHRLAREPPDRRRVAEARHELGAEGLEQATFSKSMHLRSSALRAASSVCGRSGSRYSSHAPGGTIRCPGSALSRARRSG